MSQSYQDILYEADRATATVTIGRPNSRAAVRRQTSQRLSDATGGERVAAVYGRRAVAFARRETVNNSTHLTIANGGRGAPPIFHP